MKYVVYGSTSSEMEKYWAGTFTERGKPKTSTKLGDAITFDTARDAYHRAGAHRKLWLWRVGRR